LTATGASSDARSPLRLRSCFAALLAVIAMQLALDAGARAAAPRIEDVEQSLTHDRSYRVRVSAALVLGRLRRARSVPYLLAALRDGHPAVRATAAQALGKIGDPATREALEGAARDGSPLVRRMAHDALLALDRAHARDQADQAAAAPAGDAAPDVRLAFEVKPMGDQSHRASPALRGHMRDYLSDRLRPVGEVTGDVSPARGFIVDGVIKHLTMTTHPGMVEVTCAVQLVISRQPTGGVFLLTTGEAIVQKPRQQFRPQQRAGMELEALENAVRGASEDLVHHLARP
jgi:hypothetical protein